MADCVPQQAPDLRLPNAGPGPDPLSLSEVAAREDVEAIVLLFHRDDYCMQCRNQVQEINDRYAEFTTRNAWVISVLPEDEDTARDWVERYSLMFPLLADPDHTAAEAFGQPTRFGALGRLSDLLGRLPYAAVLDTREGELDLRFTHEGDTTNDRPSVDELLTRITGITDHEGADLDAYG